MSQGQINAIKGEAEKVFAGIDRPEHFTNINHCCECREHDEELQPYTPATVPRSALGTMAWDPITFCTDEAFRYWLPGLIRIVLSEDGEDNYYEQFLWHLSADNGGYDRYAACTESERSVVAKTLHFLLEHRSAEIERECMAPELLNAIGRWSDRDGI